MKRGIMMLLAGLLALPAFAGDDDTGSIDRGRKLVVFGGCNDCHTEGYAMSEGKVPESEWLKGSTMGWYGPWGTTYPINLRNFLQTMDESQWLAFARTKRSRPPMPWFALAQLEDEALLDLYRYIRSLGPAGADAPAYLPPGKVPPKPYFAAVLPDPPAADAQK